MSMQRPARTKRGAGALPGLTNGIYDGVQRQAARPAGRATWRCSPRAGADTVALFDTAAGEIDAATYGEHRRARARGRCSRASASSIATTPVTYYSRGTGPAYWDQLDGLPFQCLGIDWRHDMAEVLARYGGPLGHPGQRGSGMAAPARRGTGAPLARIFRAHRGACPPALRRGWICGLGHGILQRTPEANVRRFVAAAAGDLRVMPRSAGPALPGTTGRARATPATRRVAHWGAAPHGAAVAGARWIARLAANAAQRGVAMYVHIPFCQALCTFCGCNMRIARNHALAAPYVPRRAA